MRRRDILRKCGGVLAVGGFGALAGCTGGKVEEEEGSADLKITSFDHGETDSGKLVVTVTVKNDGDADGTGTLYVTVEAGDDVTRKSPDVSVAAGETETVAIEYPFDYETFKGNGRIKTDLRS